MTQSLLLAGLALAAGAEPATYEQRVAAVTSVPGFVALWDFVQREPAGARRFTAHRPPGATNDYALDARNYVREFWGQGREATYDDFPLLGRGPFGQAIQLRAETDPNFRPLLLVPRERFHDSPLDVKGPGRSVTIIAWVIRHQGNHGIAGIWHEGTDLNEVAAATKVQRGMRQYALFAGLQYPGAVAGHVSENGTNSFGDIYARHKATTPDLIPTVAVAAAGETLDHAWSTVGLVFDNDHDEAIAYLNGRAGEKWDDHPTVGEPHTVRAWRHDRLPPDQYYSPPEDAPLQLTVERETAAERVELRRYRYTRVRVTLRRDGAGQWTEATRELAAVRLNPWWFPHELYAPARPAQGGPFTIGRVVHSGRSVGFTGYLGGVAVFERALAAEEMARLAAIGRDGVIAAPR